MSKRDTRTFRDGPVAEEDINKVLQAARMAGSAKNEQVNRLIVVTDEDDRAKLGECGKLADWIPGAPVVIAILVPKEGGRPFDMGRMAQNMLVMANSLGLASCPVTFHDQDCVRELLGIPEDYEAPMGVGIGHPASDDDRESSPRIPLEELVDWGRWQS
ncbi:MAG: nitroreductase family protein [Acidimicrobiales bacterium]